jgi:hypothetical protein
MTESSPQPGDNETHDATAEGSTLSTEPEADRGTAAATAADQTRDAQHAAPEPAVEASTGRENNGDEEVEEGAEDEEEDEEDEDDDDDNNDDDDDEEESDEEDEEPKLKYARLTQHLAPVYRNGDATSAFLVAGDKMVRMPHVLGERRPTANRLDRLSVLTMATSSVTRRPGPLQLSR